MINLDEIVSFYPPKLQINKEAILREYLHYKILKIIFEERISQKLVFIGGTALRLTYGTSRFSEDLDFDNFDLKRDEFEILCETIKSKLEMEAYNIDLSFNHHEAFMAKLKFSDLLEQLNLSGHKNSKLLIKLDSESQGFSYKSQSHTINKFDIFTNIKIAPLDIALSQKLLAILKRKRTMGRDFYDAIFLMSKTQPNYEFLDCRLGIKNPKDLKKQLKEKIKILDFKKLKNDLKPFVFDLHDLQRIEKFEEYIVNQF